MSLYACNNALCCFVFKANCRDDSLVKHFVELAPELVEFFNFKHDPGTHQVHSVCHQLQLMLQQIVLGLVRLASDNFHLLLDKSEEVTEKFVEQR